MVSQKLAMLIAPGFLIPALAFAFVTSVSPGPVNVISATSGANFGFSRTLPHVLGATFGFTSLLLGMGFGLQGVMLRASWLHWVLKGVAALFLGYFAFVMIMRRSSIDMTETLPRPPRLTEGFLLQWTNPKAWIVAATGVGTYTMQGPIYTSSVLTLSAIFALVCFPSISIWAAMGHGATKFLVSGNAMRWFNRSMGVLLLGSVIAVLFFG